MTRMKLRPAVQRFAEAMEKVLRDNDHKNGWEDMNESTIFDRISEERDELLVSLYECQQHDNLKHISDEDGTYMEKALGEAIDIANFCMMLYDNNLPKDEKPEASR